MQQPALLWTSAGEKTALWLNELLIALGVNTVRILPQPISSLSNEGDLPTYVDGLVGVLAAEPTAESSIPFHQSSEALMAAINQAAKRDLPIEIVADARLEIPEAIAKYCHCQLDFSNPEDLLTKTPALVTRLLFCKRVRHQCYPPFREGKTITYTYDPEEGLPECDGDVTSFVYTHE